MERQLLKYLLVVFVTAINYSCKKPYTPEAIIAPNNYLVVDGFINTAPNGITTIQLSRTKNLTDSTSITIPEYNAQVTIESKNGSTYTLHQVSDVSYASNPLQLSAADTYRLHIKTADGREYLSDYVAVKQAPAIDSLTWKQDQNVTVYLNTHDNTNTTRYYRWDFTETWQHNARLETSLGVSNNMIFYSDTTTSTYRCWTSQNSTSIILGTSSALSEDVINKAPITTIFENDVKMGIRYSILVRQYALTEEAYQYWEIIRKNTQQIGTLFDLQPSQLHGNIVSSSNPTEPVIGFVSAGSVREKRIFISYNELQDWKVPLPQEPCDILNIAQNPSNYLIWDYFDPEYRPWYFTSPSGINIAKKYCLDCREQGGTNAKPSYWP